VRFRLRPDIAADNVSVYQVLEKGLEDLMNMCDVVTEKFTISRDEFINQMEQ
jgi:DNA-directed RNA polymerase I and III subunit RPAC2